jgi:AcrR family transcriptional regulator/DNA-binding MarR family transcriptional regulator
MAAEEAGATRRSRGSEAYVSELQRARLLSATFALVGERGYEGVSARSVSERAGVSNRTFYEAFSDREDCFLAAFDHAVDGLGLVLGPLYESEGEWVAKVRAGLAALLQTLEREPAVRRLVFVEALRAGPRVLARRAAVLEQLAGVIDGGRAGCEVATELPEMTAAAVVGATFGVIHARLLEVSPAPLSELLGALMATIVLPYRGSAEAARELERPAPGISTRAAQRNGSLFGRPLGSASPVDYRLTVRTQMALAAIAGHPDLNNREVSEIIGLADQGQVSRMMKRLREQGLVENARGHTRRLARAWRLTPQGEAVIAAHRPLRPEQLRTSRGGKLAVKRGRNGGGMASGAVPAASIGFRLTALTHEVLSVVASLNVSGSAPKNREVAGLAGIDDEGQVSKLLARLQTHGLLQNTGGHPAVGNAWRLTPHGEQVLCASSRAALERAQKASRRRGR